MHFKKARVAVAVWLLAYLVAYLSACLWVYPLACLLVCPAVYLFFLCVSCAVFQ